MLKSVLLVNKNQNTKQSDNYSLTCIEAEISALKKLYYFFILNEQELSMERTPTKIWPSFGKFGGQIGQKMANEKAQHISPPPPLNETLSHSNGKVVFDHGPNSKPSIKNESFPIPYR